MVARPANAVMLILLALWMTGPTSQAQGAQLVIDVAILEASIYQGDTANLSMTVTYAGNYEVEVLSIGVHADWMPKLWFDWTRMTDQPFKLVPNRSFSLTVPLPVPHDVTPGPHNWMVKVQFMECDASGQWGPPKTHTSDEMVMQVHDAYERTFLQLSPTVLQRISSVGKRDLERPEALALLSQAEKEYSLADKQAGDALYQEAVKHLQTSLALADQALGVEENYWHQLALNLTSSAEKKLSSKPLEQPESPEAKALASEAQKALAEAQVLTHGKEYRAAVSRIQEAEAFAEQAINVESEYQGKKTNLYIVGGSLLISTACVTIALTASVWRRRKARRLRTR